MNTRCKDCAYWILGGLKKLSGPQIYSWFCGSSNMHCCGSPAGQRVPLRTMRSHTVVNNVGRKSWISECQQAELQHYCCYPAELSKSFKNSYISFRISVTQAYGSTPSCENINCIVDPGFKGTMCCICVLEFFFWMLHWSYVILKCISDSKSLEQYQNPPK